MATNLQNKDSTNKIIKSCRKNSKLPVVREGKIKETERREDQED